MGHNMGFLSHYYPISSTSDYPNDNTQLQFRIVKPVNIITIINVLTTFNTQAGAVLASDASSVERTMTKGEGRGQMRFPISYLSPLPLRNHKSSPVGVEGVGPRAIHNMPLPIPFFIRNPKGASHAV